MNLLKRIKYLLKKETTPNYDIDSKTKSQIKGLSKLADVWQEQVKWLRNIK